MDAMELLKKPVPAIVMQETNGGGKCRACLEYRETI